MNSGSHTYVAMLRAINLSGRNRVSMAELRELFRKLGAEDVRTYVQSGNVVFTSRVGGPGRLARAIEEGVAEGIGVSARVIVRREDELGRVVAGNPFVDGRRDPALLHVTFSAGEPDPQAVRELAATSFDADEVHVAGREVYLHCPNGYGRSKLSNAFLERKLGVVATTRSWKTVTALAEMARGK